jgi:thymidylate synthase
LSADFPVGVPFNIAGYALLLHMFAAQLKMKPAKFIHTFGDAHIYVDQLDGVDELLARVDNPDIEIPALPTLVLNPNVKSLFDYKSDDIKLVGYRPLQPQIKFPVAE